MWGCQVWCAVCIYHNSSQNASMGKYGRGHRLGELPKIFAQRLKLATSNLMCILGLPN